MANPLLLAAAGVQIVGSIFSFGEAKKQRDAMKKAQNAAAVAAAEAKKELSVNYMKGLSIAKEPYELEREALAQAGASALAAGVAGDPRGAAATAGRVVQAQQAGLARQRAAMSQEMSQLDRLVAQEESRLGSARAQVNLAEATGAQAAAQDAMKMRAYNMQQGFSQLGGGLSGLATSGLLDGKKGSSQTPTGFEGFAEFEFDTSPGYDITQFGDTQFGNIDLSGVTSNNDTIDFSSMSIFGQSQTS